MNLPKNDLLLVSGKALTLLIQGVVALGTAVIALTIIGVLFFQDTIDAELRAEYGADIISMPVAPVIGLLAVVVFLFFGKLRGMIDTVGQGDPFVPENADRLNAMAWLQISIYVVGFIAVGIASMVAAWAQQFVDTEIDTSIDFDIGAILLVLVLFILARVFRHGAAMRADLEGTV